MPKQSSVASRQLYMRRVARKYTGFYAVHSDSATTAAISRVTRTRTAARELVHGGTCIRTAYYATALHFAQHGTLPPKHAHRAVVPCTAAMQRRRRRRRDNDRDTSSEEDDVQALLADHDDSSASFTEVSDDDAGAVSWASAARVSTRRA